MNNEIHGKDSVILSINTSDNKEIILKLTINGKEKIIREKIERGKSQLVLLLIEKILMENEKQLSDMTDIIVHIGPGSFTGLRVGISIANALAYSLHIPVNNLPIGTFVTPQY